MRKEQTLLLNKLIDKYERSKTFQGDNKVIQKFSIRPEKVFPAYVDDSQFEAFDRINEAVRELEIKNIVSVRRKANGVIDKITLNLEELDKGYKICNRTPKKDIHLQLKKVWEKIRSLINEKEILEIFNNYIEEQEACIKQNKQVAYFDGDINNYEEKLQAIYKVLKNDKEQFIRDFSVSIFGDSKKLELMEGQIRSFLYEYGEAASKEDALEEYGIVRTPTNVSIKGEAIIKIGEQFIDLSKIDGDISFSTISIEQIKQVKVTGHQIVTVENLTSFHSFDRSNSFVIYLGGYHNSIKRNFLKQIYADNPDKEFLHFGDIDAGGFYIYEHLLEKSQIPFRLFKMDIETLIRHKKAWKKLTLNDRKRIELLLRKEKTKDYHDVLKFMLEHNCKLEQEAVGT